MSAIDQPFSTRRRAAMLAAAAAVTLVLSACGAGGGNPVGNDQHSTPASSTSSAHAGHPSDSMPGMPGMDHAAGGNGLSANESGLTLQPGSGSLRAGVDTTWTYRITAAGKPVTVFESEQTKLMHLYVVRSDLTGFQHAHPVMASDGTWTANLTALQPGSYRIYTQFSTRAPGGAPIAAVLSVPVTVPGAPVTVVPAAVVRSVQVDGYTVAVDANVTAGAEGELSLTISKDGRPVADLQPYLDSYAHLTAIHAGDLAFAHLHPIGAVEGDHGGPTLAFHVNLPEAGLWGLFVQFQTAGVLHTGRLVVAA